MPNSFGLLVVASLSHSPRKFNPPIGPTVIQLVYRKNNFLLWKPATSQCSHHQGGKSGLSVLVLNQHQLNLKINEAAAAAAELRRRWLLMGTQAARCRVKRGNDIDEDEWVVGGWS